MTCGDCGLVMRVPVKDCSGDSSNGPEDSDDDSDTIMVKVISTEMSMGIMVMMKVLVIVMIRGVVVMREMIMMI